MATFYYRVVSPRGVVVENGSSAIAYQAGDVFRDAPGRRIIKHLLSIGAISRPS